MREGQTFENRGLTTPNLHAKATELGFDRISITSAEPIPEAEERFQQWLAQGYQGEMNYLSNNPQRRQNPQQVLPGAKSMIVVAINYNPPSPSTPQSALRIPQFLETCGRCTRCLDACPTQAFTAPYQLDARKCIAYLTIEHRGPIPEDLQSKMGDWIFGCDICQEVCPYNRHAPQTKEPAFHAEAGAGPALGLDEVLAIQSDEEYLKRFQGTPLMRAKRAGLQKNATVVLKNTSSDSLLPR